MVVYLLGFMGCGKTRLGKKLAVKLNYEFVDTDHEIENKLGITLSELFTKQEGESCFRNQEAALLNSVSKSQRNLVVATGGGTPCFFDNMKIINTTGFSVYIKLQPQSIYHRLRQNKLQRPLISNLQDTELRSFIKDNLQQRQVFYSQAHLTVKGEDLKPEALFDTLKSHPLFAKYE
ncbi:MAG: shikimate kinase [Bacteroidia bacterium]|nr:shikimate kinase [Bacteroidia bacterium]MCZ2276755.1 shikimate kinase [Bacteroidia bacterium]